MSDEYHMVGGVRWPNCLTCGSEDTSVVPKTGNWTCEECGRQWHSDEIPFDQGDGGEIPDIIGSMVHDFVEGCKNDPDVFLNDAEGGR